MLFCFCLFLKGLCFLNFGIRSEAGSNFLNRRLSSHCSLPYPEHSLVMSILLVLQTFLSGQEWPSLTELAWLLREENSLLKKQVCLCGLLQLFLSCLCPHRPTCLLCGNGAWRPLLHSSDMLFELPNFRNCGLNKPLFCINCVISVIGTGNQLRQQHTGRNHYGQDHYDFAVVEPGSSSMVILVGGLLQTMIDDSNFRQRQKKQSE